MAFYLGKIIQAGALGYVAISYILTLPETPRGRSLAIGGAIFLAGWIVERFTRGRRR